MGIARRMEPEDQQATGSYLVHHRRRHRGLAQSTYGRLVARLSKGSLLVALNQLLAELDGSDPSVGGILLAAINRTKILIRRCCAPPVSTLVLIDRPDQKRPRKILDVHMCKTEIASDVDLGRVAALTTGLTGALIANLVDEVMIIAIRRNAHEVTFKNSSMRRSAS